MRRQTLGAHENSTRSSYWTLIQNSDRTLHVEQRAQYSGGEEKVRTVSINEFMQESGPPPGLLQAVIDRMFKSGDPSAGSGSPNSITDYARGLRDAAAMLDVDRQTLRLHAGELSTQEMRTVQAVLRWKRQEILKRVEGTSGG